MQSLVILRCCFVEEEKKFVKIYNAHAQLLFFSLNLLFSDVPVPVAVVVFFKLPNVLREYSFMDSCIR